MVAQYRALVKSHIEYDVMCEQYGEEQLDEIVYLIIEVLCSKAQFFTINGSDVPAELVRSQLLKFNSLHLQYGVDVEKAILPEQKQSFDEAKTIREEQKQSVQERLDGLGFTPKTISHIMALYDK